MMNKNSIMAVDRMLRDVRQSDAFFGGIVMLFAGKATSSSVPHFSLTIALGDIRQCLPVVRRGMRSEAVNATITNAEFWPIVRQLHLDVNMRVRAMNDEAAAEFSKWLLGVGDGVAINDGNTIDIPAIMRLPRGADRPELCRAIYPNIAAINPVDISGCATYFTNRAILAPHNHSVGILNDMLIDDFPGEAHVAFSVDQAFQDGTLTDVPDEFLHAQELPGFPPHRSVLKVGCPIILLRNLVPSEGLCNGTRLIITQIASRVLGCRIVSGTFQGKDVLIPRIKLTSAANSGLPFSLHRRQFPVRLAFAMSINKAQGQSLDHVGLDLTIPVFSHGQLYVALSRSTSSNSISVLLSPDANGKTPNIVYREVFTND